MFELTVPFEGNIKDRNLLKSNKYSHFATDIKTYEATVTAFEVGSRVYLTNANVERLKRICSFCGKGTKPKQFLESISSLAITSSYFIYTARKQPTWSTPGFMTD